MNTSKFIEICLTLFVVFGLPINSIVEAGILFQSNSSGTSHSFSRSKRVISKLYANMDRSFYCHCKIDFPLINISKCGIMQNFSMRKRTSSIDYEHVVPASLFKRRLLGLRPVISLLESCQSLSRRCIRTTLPEFSALEADLHNIRPVVSKLNRLRGNKRMGIVKNIPRKNLCGFKISNKFFEPSDNVKGDVARIYLYMDQKYPELKLVSKLERALFKNWDVGDPVDKIELLLNQRIRSNQGDYNFYVK